MVQVRRQRVSWSSGGMITSHWRGVYQPLSTCGVQYMAGAALGGGHRWGWKGSGGHPGEDIMARGTIVVRTSPVPRVGCRTRWWAQVGVSRGGLPSRTWSYSCTVHRRTN